LPFAEKLKQEFPDAHFIKHTRLRALSNLILNLFSKIPFQVAYYHNPALHRLVKGLAQEHRYDIVYTHLIRMVPYARYFDPQKIILDYTDCISLEYFRSLSHRKTLTRMFFTIEAIRTRSYEQSVASRFAENWLISPIDRHVMGLENHAKTVIIPNQVQIADTEPSSTLQWRIIFTGNMSVAHNVTAVQNVCLKIMPVLIKRFSKLVFIIAGAEPNPEVLALDKVNNTKVIGYVEDLYEELLQSDIFVAPMYFSAGIQNKALEAMACGLPVVTTGNVAKSLDVHDEVEIMVADDNLGFVNRITQLLTDHNTRQQIGRAGKAHVMARFSTEAVTRLMNERIDNFTQRQGVLE
jgi:glycosyltransferase involved in cell wall biosynthesis